MSTENPAFKDKGSAKKPNIMQRFSNLRRGKRKDPQEIERKAVSREVKKSNRIKRPQKGAQINASNDIELTEEEARVQQKIIASPEFRKFAEKIEKKQARRNNFAFLKGKKRRVGRDIYQKAYGHEKIHKLGYLTKQGGRVKSWKKRYFVLYSKMLFYFESLEAYNEEKPPKGWIFLKDILPTKKNYVCTPTAAYIWRGKFNAFTIQTEKRLFALAAKTKEERLVWMKTIRRVYEEFWTGYGLPIPQAESPNGPEDDSGTLAQLRPLAVKMELFDEMEENEIEEKTRLLMLAQCMIRWKTYVKINQLEKS